MESNDTGERDSWWAREEQRRQRCRPDNEIPGSVAFEAVLGETEDLAVFICGLTVYRNGVDLNIEVRASPGYAESRNEDEDFLGGAVVGGGLLLGVEFADGRRCTNLPGPLEGRGPRADEPILYSDGGGGGSRSASASWFLSPLPPPGDIRIFSAWPSRGMPESFTTLPAEPILAAAARARELWPWRPEREMRHRIPPSDVPEGGWFAEQAPPSS